MTVLWIQHVVFKVGKGIFIAVVLIIVWVQLISVAKPGCAVAVRTEGDLAGVGQDVLVFDDHVFGSLDFVVDHYDFAFHELKANVADCTRVI